MENILQELHDKAITLTSPQLYQDHGGACGFAWVTVQGPIRKKADKETLSQAGFKYSAYEKGWVFWVGYYGQSMHMKEDFAANYAKLIRENTPFKAYAGSRMD